MNQPNALSDAMQALRKALARAGGENPVTEHVLTAMVAVAQARTQLLGIAGSCPCPLAKSAMKS